MAATGLGTKGAVTLGLEDREAGGSCSQCSGMQKQSRQRNGEWRTYPVVCKRSRGMMAIIPGSMLVWALLIATVAPYSVSARPDDQRRSVIPTDGHRVGLLPPPEEDFSDNYDQPPQEVAALLKLMIQQAESQSRAQEEQWEDDLEQGGPSAPVGVGRNFEALPVPMRLMRQPEVTGKNADAGKEKRGYMSLCHFKICNMGRKRNLRWTPWARNPPF